MGSQSSQPASLLQSQLPHQTVNVCCKSKNAEYLRLRAVYFACKTHPKEYHSLDKNLSIIDKYNALCKINGVILLLVSDSEPLPVSTVCTDEQDHKIIAAYVNAHYETGRCSECK